MKKKFNSKNLLANLYFMLFAVRDNEKTPIDIITDKTNNGLQN